MIFTNSIFFLSPQTHFNPFCIRYNFFFASQVAQIKMSQSFKYGFIYLFLVVLGLGCCAGFSLVAVHGFLIVVTSLVAEQKL